MYARGEHHDEVVQLRHKRHACPERIISSVLISQLTPAPTKTEKAMYSQKFSVCAIYNRKCGTK